MNEIQFDHRVKRLARILLVSNVFDIFFYDPTKAPWVNITSLGLTMGFGVITAWGVHQRKAWGRILLYFAFLLGLFSLFAWPDLSKVQKTAFVLSYLPFLFLLYHFHRYPALTAQFFQPGGFQRKWKIAIITLGALLVIGFGAISAAGLYFRRQGASLMADMKTSLVLEGDVDPKIMGMCKEKFGRKIEDAAILEKFCHCFGLNSGKVLEHNTPTSELVTRSVALTMACWPAEAPPMKGLSQ